jgi:hypothetical protein
VKRLGLRSGKLVESARVIERQTLNFLDSRQITAESHVRRDLRTQIQSIILVRDTIKMIGLPVPGLHAAGMQIEDF